jgi:hypothetical protein
MLQALVLDATVELFNKTQFTIGFGTKFDKFKAQIIQQT